jgi:large repetitive protein
MENRNNIEQQGRALLRESARQIRKSETSKFRRISAGSMAMAVVAMQVLPAFATINNTVTATGTGPGATTVTGTATATVGVQLANPKITVVKTATLVDIGGGAAGKGDAGETINYTYVVTNTGNVTVTGVGVADAHDGAGTPPSPTNPTLTTDVAPTADSTDGVPTDNKWDTLKPGDSVTFTASYLITAADINANGGGATPDGNLHNTATAAATYTNPQGTPTTTTVTATNTKSVPLNILSSLAVTKVADKTTNVKVGDVITYTYTVKNTGNVKITGVNLVDTHNASGAVPVPKGETLSTDAAPTGDSTDTTANDGTWSVLAPGDTATFTATYTVTQSDVDNLQ